MTTTTKTTTTEKIIENHVLDEIFCEYPTDKDAFEFFLEADVNCAEDVSMSPLGEEYEVCQAYELDNIRSIRGLMQSMKCDLERLIIKVSEVKELESTIKNLEKGFQELGFSQEQTEAIAKGSKPKLVTDDILKSIAVGLFTSDCGDARDFDEITDKRQKKKFMIWEPFENWDNDSMTELIVNTFETLKKKLIPKV